MGHGFGLVIQALNSPTTVPQSPSLWGKRPIFWGLLCCMISKVRLFCRCLRPDLKIWWLMCFSDQGILLLSALFRYFSLLPWVQTETLQCLTHLDSLWSSNNHSVRIRHVHLSVYTHILMNSKVNHWIKYNIQQQCNSSASYLPLSWILSASLESWSGRRRCLMTPSGLTDTSHRE